MKVLFDEGVPEPLVRELPGHEVSTVKGEGWKGIENGKLLNLMEAAAFEAFLTNDKRMKFEQRLQRRPFAILILSAMNWPVIRPHVEKIAAAVNQCERGTVTKIDCGAFVPRKFRKPGEPSFS